jgi:hypothetical protein
MIARSPRARAASPMVVLARAPRARQRDP